MAVMSEMLNNDTMGFQMTVVKLWDGEEPCPEPAVAIQLESVSWSSSGLFLPYHMISRLFKFHILSEMAIHIYTQLLWTPLSLR